MRDQLDDGTVRIRRYSLDDVDGLHAAARESTAAVGEWLPWLDEGYGRHDSRAWIEACRSAWRAGAWFACVVEQLADGRFLGGVGLHDVDRGHRRAELGYWVRTDATRKGVATRASALMLTLGIEDLGLTRIGIVCAMGNVRSQGVAEKLGARREGVLRDRLVIGDVAHDAVVFSITPGWKSPFTA